MQAYPMEKRQAVLATYAAGKKTQEVAKEHGVSRSWARRVKQRHHEPSRTRRLPSHRRREPRWAEHAERIEVLMDKNPDMKLRELKAALQTDLSVQTLSRALRLLGLSKNRRPRGWRERMEDYRQAADYRARTAFSRPTLADQLQQQVALNTMRGF